MNKQKQEQVKKLEMYGGTFGGLIPLIVLITILVVLSVAERGGTAAFWAGGWLAIVVGLFFAKNKEQYCGTIMRGLGDENGIVIVTAWLFAGVFGQLMVAGGLVDGLLWLGLKMGATGAMFTVMSFVAAAIFATGTGTSTGTVLALVPVLYPAGIFLGSNPAMLGVSVIAGAAFGDNLAPVSDTTIVSAFTQGAEIGDVVRSRAPLALSAATLAIIVFLITGGGGDVSSLPELDIITNPAGLFMLISLGVVVTSALLGRHILESLIYGNVSAGIVGMLNGQLSFSTIFTVPAVRGESTGLIQDGISGVTGAIIFALLVLAVTQILIESGVMDSILNWAQNTIAKNSRQAEFAILSAGILASIPIAANAPALLLIGPSFVKPLGEKFNLSPARRANIMDASACTIFFIVPWHIAVIVWYGTLTTAAETWGLPLPSIWTAAYNPYTWTLLGVVIFSIMTGWNRTFEDEELGFIEGEKEGKLV